MIVIGEHMSNVKFMNIIFKEKKFYIQLNWKWLKNKLTPKRRIMEFVGMPPQNKEKT